MLCQLNGLITSEYMHGKKMQNAQAAVTIWPKYDSFLALIAPFSGSSKMQMWPKCHDLELAWIRVRVAKVSCVPKDITQTWLGLLQVFGPQKCCDPDLAGVELSAVWVRWGQNVMNQTKLGFRQVLCGLVGQMLWHGRVSYCKGQMWAKCHKPDLS